MTQAFRQESQPFVQNIAFTSANSPGWNTLYANGYAPNRGDILIACNSDTIDHEVQFRVHCINYYTTVVGTVLVPAGAGFSAAIPPIDVLAALPAFGGAVALDLNSTFDANCLIVPTGILEVHVICMGGML